MGLKDVFQSAAALAIDAFGDVIASAVYQEAGSTDYDITSGEVNTISNRHAIRGAFPNYKSSEINGTSVLSTDKKALIAGKTINFEPKVDDTILFNLESWQVLDVKTDPVSALWTLQIRKP